MTVTLLVGFDSAWTPTNSGGIVGVLQLQDGTYRELGPAQIVNYTQAEAVIASWQSEHSPSATIILLDQPTIVKNAAGQRPAENIAASPVSLRYGGMQPANTTRAEMFGAEAPVWSFLTRFGGAADPLAVATGTQVFETYPVLAMIALGWMLPDSRAAGRLPKYNPERRTTFAISDWQHVRGLASAAFREPGLMETAAWIDAAAKNGSPRKKDQDRLDACRCLLVALHLSERKECPMVGDLQTGYIVVPHGPGLHAEFEARRTKTGRVPSDSVKVFRLRTSAA